MKNTKARFLYNLLVILLFTQNALAQVNNPIDSNQIIEQKVEQEGKCRFAVIPDGIVEVEDDDYEENDMDEV